MEKAAKKNAAYTFEYHRSNWVLISLFGWSYVTKKSLEKISLWLWSFTPFERWGQDLHVGIDGYSDKTTQYCVCVLCSSNIWTSQCGIELSQWRCAKDENILHFCFFLIASFTVWKREQTILFYITWNKESVAVHNRLNRFQIFILSWSCTIFLTPYSSTSLKKKLSIFISISPSKVLLAVK